MFGTYGLLHSLCAALHHCTALLFYSSKAAGKALRLGNRLCFTSICDNGLASRNWTSRPFGWMYFWISRNTFLDEEGGSIERNAISAFIPYEHLRKSITYSADS